MVNITLAAILQDPDRTQYARECLDLLDLIRQQWANQPGIEEDLEHISDLEETARNMIRTVANSGGASTTARNETDPTVESSRANELNALTSVAEHAASASRNLSTIESSPRSTIVDDRIAQDGDVVWEGEFVPLGRAPPNLP